MHLAPKITFIGHHSAPLCKIPVFLGSCPLPHIGKYLAWKYIWGMVVPNGTFKWLVQVYGVVLVQLAPKIALIGHRSAPLSQKVCLSIGAYSRLYLASGVYLILAFFF